MKKLIESGYINGKLERHIPFFTYAQVKHGNFWSNKKRDMKTSGVFNILAAPKDRLRVSFRGVVCPVDLCENQEKKDFFLKFQRFIKKNKNKNDFIATINTYLKNNGYGYLELNPCKSPRHSYLVFEINEQVYLELLHNFYYINQALDAAGETVEILKTTKFNFNSYTQFLEKIYPKEKLLKYDIFPFELVYVYENIANRDDCEYEEEKIPYKLSRYNLEKYFQLKDDVEISNLKSVRFTIIEHGWIDLEMIFSDKSIIVNCSSVFDPFLSIYEWTSLIEKDNRSHVLEIDEEGSVVTFKAYSFNEFLYVIIYNKWDNNTLYEGIFKRSNFANLFRNELEKFIMNDFINYKGDFFWQENIQDLKSILLLENKRNK